MKTLNQLIQKMIQDQKMDQLKDLEYYKNMLDLNQDQVNILTLKHDFLKQLDQIETNLFVLKMKDRWDNNDYLLFDQLNDQVKELKNML